ncbi:PepSY domain-containing protein [bacterium]|nr:PepSY domain-containing protein [bacterium]
MENIGYILLGIAAICWIVAIIIGVVAAFPIGIIGLIAILGIGFLFAKVIKDRLENKEDDHYSETIDK